MVEGMHLCHFDNPNLEGRHIGIYKQTNKHTQTTNILLTCMVWGNSINIVVGSSDEDVLLLVQPFARIRSNHTMGELIRQQGLDPFNNIHLLQLTAACHVKGGDKPVIKVKSAYVPDKIYKALLESIPAELPTIIMDW